LKIISVVLHLYDNLNLIVGKVSRNPFNGSSDNSSCFTTKRLFLVPAAENAAYPQLHRSFAKQSSLTNNILWMREHHFHIRSIWFPANPSSTKVEKAGWKNQNSSPTFLS
jgi:hypothetical protein